MKFHEQHLLPPPHHEGLYDNPRVPDNRVPDEDRADLKDLHGPRKCLVGNIKTQKDANPDWQGPKLFNKGQKIFLIQVSDDRLVVLGRHRQKNGYINTWLNASHTENWRIQTVYKRAVLHHTSDYYFRDNTLEEVRDCLNSKERFP